MVREEKTGVVHSFLVNVEFKKNLNASFFFPLIPRIGATKDIKEYRTICFLLYAIEMMVIDVNRIKCVLFFIYKVTWRCWLMVLPTGNPLSPILFTLVTSRIDSEDYIEIRSINFRQCNTNF